MASRKLRNNLNRSDRSEKSFVSGETESEHFWSIELNAEKRTFTWTVKEDLEDDDDDYVDHTLFIRQAVLGGGAVPDEQNVVTLESMGTEGEKVKGTIVNLTRGVNSMCALELTIPGKSGGTFTLAEGSGPIFINGAHLLEFPREDQNANNSQTESELSEDLQEEEDEDNEVEIKPAKRKAAKMNGRQDKQKPKMEVEDEDDEEDEEDDDEDDEDFDEDEEDEEEEESPKVKSKKKVQETKAKAIVKEVQQKAGKVSKKVKTAKK